MKTLHFCWLLIGVLWLVGSLTLAQPSLASKPDKPVSRQSDGRPVINPSGTYRPQSRFQPETALQLNPHKQPLTAKRSPMPTSDSFFLGGILGVVLFMSLFTATQFLLNRDASYGWYAAYLTTTLLWLWQSVRVWFDGVPQPSDSIVLLLPILLSSYGMMITYLLFLNNLLEVPQQQPRLQRWVGRFFRFAAASILISVTELLIWHSLYICYITNLLLIGGMLILLVETMRSKHPLKPYALTGSSLLMGGSIISFAVGFTGPNLNHLLSNLPLGQMAYMAIGTVLEILCFSLALGRRFQINKEEKIQAQNDLIRQLEENQQLQHSHTIELEQQLAQRETEVLSKAHELEDQRLTQLRSDFERRVAEAEMAGLRSQMNPHFIFNCLNSIKLYATENDSEKASDYLTKFSRLIRLVLENSRSERITLRNELDMLQLYADMEIMRFKHKLSFFVEVEPGIDAGFVEIPPLLLQPYVENAIWHGLMHKPEGGAVHIRATQPQENLLQLTITDDGVGRVRATELKSKSANHRKSFGLKMTSERIALVNQLYHTHTQVRIADLVATDGQPAGTEVTIQIPI